MSTYNLTDFTYLTIKENSDEVIMCMAKKDLMRRKMGIGEDLKNKDINLFLYSYELLSDRFCKMAEENDCLLSKINSLLYKYK